MCADAAVNPAPAQKDLSFGDYLTALKEALRKRDPDRAYSSGEDVIFAAVTQRFRERHDGKLPNPRVAAEFAEMMQDFEATNGRAMLLDFRMSSGVATPKERVDYKALAADINDLATKYVRDRTAAEAAANPAPRPAPGPDRAPILPKAERPLSFDNDRSVTVDPADPLTRPQYDALARLYGPEKNLAGMTDQLQSRLRNDAYAEIGAAVKQIHAAEKQTSAQILAKPGDEDKLKADLDVAVKAINARMERAFAEIIKRSQARPQERLTAPDRQAPVLPTAPRDAGRGSPAGWSGGGGNGGYAEPAPAKVAQSKLVEIAGDVWFGGAPEEDFARRAMGTRMGSGSREQLARLGARPQIDVFREIDQVRDFAAACRQARTAAARDWALALNDFKFAWAAEFRGKPGVYPSGDDPRRWSKEARESGAARALFRRAGDIRERYLAEVQGLLKAQGQPDDVAQLKQRIDSAVR